MILNNHKDYTRMQVLRKSVLLFISYSAKLITMKKCITTSKINFIKNWCAWLKIISYKKHLEKYQNRQKEIKSRLLATSQEQPEHLYLNFCFLRQEIHQNVHQNIISCRNIKYTKKQNENVMATSPQIMVTW